MGPTFDRTQAFEIISFAPRAPDNWKGAILLLDTQVVSALDGIAQNGFKPEHHSHVRAANLLRRCWAEGIEALHHPLDAFEGSGFHRGGVESYNVIHRFAAIQSLLSLGRDRLDTFLESGLPAEGGANVDTARSVSLELAEVSRVLPWVYHPSYAMCLALHLTTKNRETRILDAVTEIFKGVPLVPDVPVLAAIAAISGKGDLRGHARDGVFLLGRVGDARAIRSAAWDLAHLEYLDYMSLVRWRGGPTEKKVTTAQCLLVTEDRNLARLGRALIEPAPYEDLMLRPGEVVSSELDAARRFRRSLQSGLTDLRILSDEARLYRLVQTSLVPIIAKLESALDIPHLLLEVWPMSGEAAPRNWSLIYNLLLVLPSESEVLVDFLTLATNREPEVLLPVLHYTVLMLHENARVRRRGLDESLTALVLFDGREPTDALTGQVLVIAACQTEDSHLLLNAILKHMAIDDARNFGPVLFTVVMVLQRVLRDIAKAQNTTIDLIVDVLRENLIKHELLRPEVGTDT